MPITVNNGPTQVPDITQEVNSPSLETSVIPDSISAETTETAPVGLSKTELNDPNSIKVTVSDPNTPIVILYGPPSCGKTMTLVRLTRFLVSHGYTVVPEKTFRPTYDDNYKQLCDNFDQMINSNSAATSTTNISFMLVKVLKNGRPICQLLEAPGEYYFKPDDPNRPYPAYVHEILKSTNRKVWAIMVEPDWSDSVPRSNYVTRIRNLKSMMSTRDKVIFVYNKIDLTPFVYGVGQVNTKEAIRNVQNLYPNIFVPFENQIPIWKWFVPYNCEFIPFMTGNYSQNMSGGFTYTEGHPLYVQKLWKAMLKLING